MKHRMFLLLAILVLIVSCEEKINWELQAEELNTIVVEGIITDEFITQQITLSHPVANMNEVPQPLRAADVKVIFEPHEVAFEESENQPGVYLSEHKFRASKNVVYNLEIKVDTAKYNAQSYIVPVDPLYPLPFYFHEDIAMFELIWDVYQYNPREQALYEVIIDWSHLPEYENSDSISTAKMLFYRLNTIDVSYIVFPQEREKVYFPPGSIAYISKYSLNDEYGAYLRALLIESQWQGSLFEGARGNLPGNISNGGLGFFAACAVIRETVIVE